MLTNEDYPGIDDIPQAFPFEIVDWHDGLPAPANEEERAVMDAIFDRYHDILNNNDW